MEHIVSHLDDLTGILVDEKRRRGLERRSCECRRISKKESISSTLEQQEHCAWQANEGRDFVEARPYCARRESGNHVLDPRTMICINPFSTDRLRMGLVNNDGTSDAASERDR
jgi:hypothetical protein